MRLSMLAAGLFFPEFKYHSSRDIEMHRNDRPKCIATTRKGNPCPNRAKYGSCCGVHRSYFREIVLDKIAIPLNDTSLVGSLDQYEIGFIADYLSLFDMILMRSTCVVCALSIREDPRNRKQSMGPNDMLKISAAHGHRDLCELARGWGAGDFSEMFYASARNGYCDICNLAREWISLSSEYIGVKGEPSFDWVLRDAAVGGYRDLCEFAKKWGARNFRNMIHDAARGGHRDICELAREWINADGALSVHDFNDMLRGAAECADGARARELCILAREWARALPAVPNTQEAPSKSLLTTETRAPLMDFNGMIYSATNGANLVRARDICELARGWLRTSSEMPEASEGGASNTPDFEWMLECAIFSGESARACVIRELAQKWIDEARR